MSTKVNGVELPITVNGVVYPAAVAGVELPPWIAPNWTRNPATGLWSNVPVAGDDVIINGEFAADTDWTKNAGWSIADGKATCNGLNGGIYQIRHIAGWWYKNTFDCTDYTSGYVSSLIGGYPGLYINSVATISHIDRATINEIAGLYSVEFIGSVGSVVSDPLPIDQLIAFRNYGHQVSIASALTLTTGFPGGVVSRLSVNPDGTLNFVHCWHDGTNLHLDTVVNSYTVVSKVNAAAAYGAGRVIEIRLSGNTTQAFYHGSQIGTDQDISAVPAGTYAGLFSTDSTVTLGDPVIT